MEPTTYALIAVLGILAVVAIFGARRRRDASLEPVRLGPSWQPPASRTAPGPPLAADPRVEVLQQRTGIDAVAVAEVVGAWDEHLAVLGFLSLPTDHRYRVYDPYDPPIAGRGPDNRPVADPARVARDVARRTQVPELDARSILEALLHDPDDATSTIVGERSGDQPSDQRS